MILSYSIGKLRSHGRGSVSEFGVRTRCFVRFRHSMLPLISSLEEILEPRFLSSPKISNRKYRALQGKTAGWLTSVVEGVFFFFFIFVLAQE